ncbi:MAG: O-antigen ligase family protein [Halomonas sp.]|uniref:O-antigen ligase family protein n=1 Tax=Halomonas sp. TaxID=1486246 RepID=UPI001833DBA7|nr:O-antigen ligase family protein [Halomonas sp.]NWN81520.1 O-antigen ligase family protein [Halomonas sp.]
MYRRIDTGSLAPAGVRYLAWLTAGCLPLVAMTPLLLPDGGFWALGLLSVLGLAVAVRGVMGSSLVAWRLPLLLACAALVWWGTGLVHGEGREALPFVGVLLAASAASWVRPLVARCQAAWWWGAGLTGIVTGGWALWQHGMQGVSRADGHAPMHAILYGNWSLLTGLCCLVGMAWAASRPQRRCWLAWLLAGALGGLLASLLSGSRGGWISLPVVAWLLYRLWWCHWPVRRRWRAGMLALALLALPVLLPQTGVQGRVAVAIAETRSYLADDARGSIGTRLEIYRGSLSLVAERPLLGHGLADYREGLRQRVAQGTLIPSVARHWHAHNDLLDAWVRRGLPGLLIVVGLYLIPLWATLRALPDLPASRRSLAMAGLVLPVMFLDFGLSYAFFAYPQALAGYLAWALVLVPSTPPGQGSRSTQSRYRQTPRVL